MLIFGPKTQLSLIFLGVLHIPIIRSIQKEFENKSKKCILFCHNDITKAYKMYNLKIGKLIMNIDYQFLDNES